MTTKKALKVMQEYQKWRKGSINSIGYSPTTISTAINHSIKKLKEITDLDKN